MEIIKTQNDSHHLIRLRKRSLMLMGGVLGLLVLTRFVTLAHLPFLDPSESRYALIGKIMSEDKDMITPKVYLRGEVTPFLSKPPLHFWVEALFIDLFGMNQVAVRLPSFLAALVTLTLVTYVANKLYDSPRALVSGLLLFTSGLFYYMAGSTLVDLTLTASTTGCMVSFLLAGQGKGRRESRLWAYLFFVFLATGMLTKGPIAIIYPAVSMFLWLLATKNFKCLSVLPWVKGGFLFLSLTVPVFLLIERSNTGFLEYFFLHENLLRYFIKDYGDRFGSGHRYLYGSSWFFLFAMFLPWSFTFIFSLVNSLRRGLNHDKLLLYFFCWAIGPALFLTFSRQLLGTYLLPSVGGLALFTGVTYPEMIAKNGWRSLTSQYFGFALVCSILSVAFMFYSLAEGISPEHTIVSLCIVLLLF